MLFRFMVIISKQNSGYAVLKPNQYNKVEIWSRSTFFLMFWYFSPLMMFAFLSYTKKFTIRNWILMEYWNLMDCKTAYRNFVLVLIKSFEKLYENFSNFYKIFCTKLKTWIIMALVIKWKILFLIKKELKFKNYDK